MDIITKKIDQIQFGIVSPQEIKKLSVVAVSTPELYDADGYPVEKGLMDPRMGVIDPGLKCKTCGGRLKSCLGHFGHIQLARPVLHIIYIKKLYNLLRSFCKSCGRVLLSPNDLDSWSKRLKEARSENNMDALKATQEQILFALKKKQTCPHCNAAVKKVRLERPSTFFEETRRLWPIEIREWCEKIPTEDLSAIGYDPEMMRPEWMVLTLIFVPPIVIRPSITLQNGDRSEDDLTHKLSDVVRVNQRLIENINAGAPEIIIEDLWDLLQYHITTFFNNKVSQIPPARQRTNRELKTLAQRLSGKEGRFRYNLAGKRVNFCGRSVITPEPNINLNEVGVPLTVAAELTIPELVTEWNSDWLKQLIKQGDQYPGANYVISPDGKRRKITDDTKEAITAELAPGWIVERHLMNGDIALFNRQPSLHRLSMQGHRIVTLPGKTFRINPLSCKPYNADFDGDEMNLHIPQTEEARSEAVNLLLVDHNIITPRYGLSIIGAIEDVLFGIYNLTARLSNLSKEDASDILLQSGIDVDLPKPKKGQTWDGKQIFSCILPKDINFEKEGVVINNGELVSGIIKTKLIEPEGGLLIHHITREFGSERALKFLNDLQKIGLAVNRIYPYTAPISDLDLPENAKKKISALLEETDKKADDSIKKLIKREIIPIPGKSMYETSEAMMLQILNEARNKSGKIIEESAKQDTNLMLMIKSGAGGKLLHLTQVSGFVGQQALRGKRIEFGYEGRTLSHFAKGDLSPDAHGFARNGYSKGMTPIELFFNAIVGRDSLMDTAMRTPKSGYMQRRLINALQDFKVAYDGTVRDASGQIIQFQFGGDNIDVSKSDNGGIEIG